MKNTNVTSIENFFDSIAKSLGVDDECLIISEVVSRGFLLNSCSGKSYSESIPLDEKTFLSQFTNRLNLYLEKNLEYEITIEPVKNGLLCCRKYR